MNYPELFLIFSIICGFFMAWGIGANDVANTMGTSVGAGALKLRNAVILAAIFELFGALLVGGEVTQTIQKNIIDIRLFSDRPDVLAYGMLAALLASGTWLLIATYFHWPVSTTHTIVGAVAGFGIVVLGAHAIHWAKITQIVISWVLTPVISGASAFLIFLTAQKFIFNSKAPIRNTSYLMPFYIFLTFFLTLLVTFSGGLAHLGVHVSFASGLVLSCLISVIAALFSVPYLKRIKIEQKVTHELFFVKAEKLFSILVIFTACAMAFAHGSNDVANAIGPLAAIFASVKKQPMLLSSAQIPFWIILMGAVGIVLGLATYGYRIITTVGQKITDLTPSRAFAAQLATSSTVIIASGLGLPVSTTQTLVGAILGVGFARGIGALNLNVVRNIFMSWLVTLPVGAVLSIVYFYLIRLLFSAS